MGPGLYRIKTGSRDPLVSRMTGSNHTKPHKSISLGEWFLFLSQSSLGMWLMETEPARQVGILRYISQTPA